MTDNLFVFIPAPKPKSSRRKHKRAKTVEQQRDFDEQTKYVLEVEFPPYTFSTHGLSRPPTPEEQDRPR